MFLRLYPNRFDINEENKTNKNEFEPWNQKRKYWFNEMQSNSS